MDINYDNESTCTVGAPSQVQKTGNVMSQDSGKEKQSKFFLPQIVKITLFVVLIWACRFSSEDDLQRKLSHAKISGSVVKPPFPPSKPSRVLENKPEPTSEEMLEKLSKQYCKKNKIKSKHKDKDKHLERKLTAFLKAYASADEPYEKKVLYSLLKCNCDQKNVQMNGVLRRFYLQHSKDSKFAFIKDLIMVVTVGMVVGAIICATLKIWGLLFLLIIGIAIGLKILDVFNERP